MMDFNARETLVVVVEKVYIRANPYSYTAQRPYLWVASEGTEIEVLDAVRLTDPRTGMIWRRLATESEEWVAEKSQVSDFLLPLTNEPVNATL